MALYRVIIPFNEPSAGGQKRYTTLEVEAESERAARPLGVSEFENMTVLGPSGQSPQVIESEIRVERAPAARRSAFDVAVNSFGQQVASIRLTGSLTSHNFQKLQQALDQLKESGVTRLVLDLSALSYICSTGLSLFVAAGDLFDLRLAAVPVKIAHILRMIGLDELFPTFAGVAEATKAPEAAKSD